MEKSLNGFQWETVDIIPGAGNSNQVQTYYINDASPLNQIAYYRLKQTDFNGEFQYFKIKAVECYEYSPRFDIYPNPSQGVFTINGIQAKTRIEIYDARGNLIFNKSNLPGKLEIELDGVQPGLYFVHFITGNEKVVEKIRINSGRK